MVMLLCYIPSFEEIGPSVPEKKIFNIFTIFGCGVHIGHVTQMPRISFRPPYPKRLYIKFGFDWQSGFREDDV